MKIFFFPLFAFLFLLLLAPNLVSAATMKPIFPSGYWGPFVECARTCTTEQIKAGTCQAGCQSLDELVQVALNVVSFGMTLALFVAAPILFAYGGIMIMMAGGSPDKLGQGKKILTGTLIGVLIVLGAFLIINTFVSLLNICGIGGFTPPCPP